MPPRKKRPPADELDDEPDEAYKPKKSHKGDAKSDVKEGKKPRAKKEKAVEEGIHTAHEGPPWTIHPPFLLYRCEVFVLFYDGCRIA
jgi:hypothetical protein